MKLLLLLAAVVAVNARAKTGSCQVGEWGDWSEFSEPTHIDVKSFPAVEPPSENDKGRQMFRKNMALKLEAAEHRRQCRISGDCPEMSAQVLDGFQPCEGGSAGGVPCSGFDQMDYVDLPGLGTNMDGNDMWGWTDSVTGQEWVAMGVMDGTSFVDITVATDVVVRGFMDTQTFSSSWRDMKIIGDYLYVVSEASNHGIQVFDMTRLRSETGTMVPDAHYDGIGSCHNIVANEATGFLFTVGCNSGSESGCNDGLHAVDVSNPLNPQFAGCFSTDGYVHDAECIVYDGPDAAYAGREVCFCYNEDTFTIVDVTNKAAMSMISRTGYGAAQYTHQGWMTPDRRFALMDDEADETSGGSSNTKTYVWDVASLESPQLVDTFVHGHTSIDHNQYIIGDLTYQANYESGLRVLRIDLAQGPILGEVGYFDVFPSRTAAAFNGAWNVYPYFPSGSIAISSINDGLYVVRANAAFQSNYDNLTVQKTRFRSRDIISPAPYSDCPPLVEYNEVPL